MNRAYAESGGKPHRVDPATINLGLAVDMERPDGTRFLVVPVIRDAGSASFAAFHERYEELVAGARAGNLGPDDYAGATITLTNPGTLGTTASVPRLMPGQGCIVATGAIREGPAGPMLTITSTYDHRVIQGAESGTFLGRLGGSPRRRGRLLRDRCRQPGHRNLSAPGIGSDGDDHGAGRDTGSGGHGVRGGPGPYGRGHVAGRCLPRLRPPGGQPRSAGLRAAGRPVSAAGGPWPGCGNPGPHPRRDLLGVHVPGDTGADVLEGLRATYSGSIAYEVEHLASHEERAWLRQAIESGSHRMALSVEEQRALLSRLTAVEGLEQFLHKAYLGQKRFSIEGLDALVPMLDLALELMAAAGTRRAVIGMAHRGRLNVLAHTVGMSYESVLAEFEAGRGGAAPGEADDVKYHLGASGTHDTPSGPVEVTLMPNPSHLEAVGPVVEGRARAEQSDRSGPRVIIDISRTAPILIHGDAAFAAQGVVAETFNLSRLPGYANGGTLHLIANNQVGFTTDAADARSTTYSSDLAKGFDVPIIHVNADDPEACLAAIRLAMAYRANFDADVVIDLVGYRRYGHNETDEPAYTQPAMYRAIAGHPSVRTQYLARLVAAGAIDAGPPRRNARRLTADLAARQGSIRQATPNRPSIEAPRPSSPRSATSRTPRSPPIGFGRSTTRSPVVPAGFTPASQAGHPARSPPGARRCRDASH